MNASTPLTDRIGHLIDVAPGITLAEAAERQVMNELFGIQTSYMQEQAHAGLREAGWKPHSLLRNSMWVSPYTSHDVPVAAAVRQQLEVEAAG